jgi:alpha-1,6-mannosyltransferase
VISVCYLVSLIAARSVPTSAAIAAIGMLHLAFLLAPPLLSADVFGYISFARLGALHGLNPYLHSASAVTSDPSYTYVRWHHSTSPYGPLFSLASYGLAPLGVPAAFWSLKALAAAASLACTALLAKAARRLGRSPVEAAIFFGLNPIVLVWAVGGAHNDLLLMLVVVVGATLTVAGRTGPGLGALVAASGIKAWAALILLFALLGTRGPRRLLVPALVLCAVAAAALVGFGGHLLGFARELSAEQRLVAQHSVPNQLGLLLGLGGLTSGLRIAAVVCLVGVVSGLMVRVVSGEDWLTGAGCATLALLLCSAWLLPWYTVWVLPLAALSDSSRLRTGTLVFSCYVIVSWVVS